MGGFTDSRLCANEIQVVEIPEFTEAEKYYSRSTCIHGSLVATYEGETFLKAGAQDRYAVSIGVARK